MLKTRMLEKLFVSNEQHKTYYFGQFEQNVSLMINGKIHNNTRIVVRFLIWIGSITRTKDEMYFNI